MIATAKNIKNTKVWKNTFCMSSFTISSGNFRIRVKGYEEQPKHVKSCTYGSWKNTTTAWLQLTQNAFRCVNDRTCQLPMNIDLLILGERRQIFETTRAKNCEIFEWLGFGDGCENITIAQRHVKITSWPTASSNNNSIKASGSHLRSSDYEGLTGHY